MRARFGPEVCDHRTYVIAGDGCFMEGISHEAASLAGHLGLGRLLMFYDDNHITIDGPTELAYDDDPVERFEAYGWRVRNLGEMANDVDGLEAAIREVLELPSDGPEARPTLLVLRSHIGWPSPKLTDTAAAHGSPFGADEIRVTKQILGLPPDETFWVPDEVRAFYGKEVARGAADRAAWEERFAAWDGDRAAWEAAQSGRGIDGWDKELPTFEAGTNLATRHAINQCINATAAGLPGLVAGSADLTGNNGVLVKGADMQSRHDPGGVQLHYGIREHGMGGVMTGMALHGGVLPLGGTFYVFTDYMRPAVRLAALSQAHVIYSWTHDSIGLGQDGPTHQPIEHMASLRAMPGLDLVRPADANETAEAWRAAVGADGPVGLVLTRQDVPGAARHGRTGPRGAAAGRLRAGGRGRAPPDRAPGHGQRGPTLPGRRRDPGRRGGAGPRGVAPLLGVVRAAGRGLPRLGAAPGGPGAERGGRVDLRLGPLRRRRHRHRPLRRLGAGRGQHGEVRLHGRARGRAGPGAARPDRPVSSPDRRHHGRRCAMTAPQERRRFRP